jgi:hypothetical protein
MRTGDLSVGRRPITRPLTPSAEFSLAALNQEPAPFSFVFSES